MAIQGGRPDDRRIVAHLIVRDAAQAVEFYRQAFGAEVLYQAPVPGGKVLHAHLRIAGSVIMISEENMGMPEEAYAGREVGIPTRSPQRFAGTTVILELYVDDVDAAFRRALAAGATVKSPVALAFYGDRYGQLVDPFGHVWALATVAETLSPEEVERRMMEHFGLN